MEPLAVHSSNFNWCFPLVNAYSLPTRSAGSYAMNVGRSSSVGVPPSSRLSLTSGLAGRPVNWRYSCILPLLIYTNFSIHASLPCSQGVSQWLFGLLHTLFLLTNHLFYSLHEAICRPIPLFTAQLNCYIWW